MLMDNDDVFHLVSQFLSVQSLVTLGTTCKTMERRGRGMVRTRLEAWRQQLEEEAQNLKPFEPREETEEEWQKVSQDFIRERTRMAFRKLECEVVTTAFQMNYRLDGSWNHFFGVAKNAGEIWITSLHFAAATNDVDLCRLLINHGAKVNDNIVIEEEICLDPNKKDLVKEENSFSSWYEEADDYYGCADDEYHETSFDYYSDSEDEYNADDEESACHSKATKKVTGKQHHYSDPDLLQDISMSLRGYNHNVHPITVPFNSHPHHSDSAAFGASNHELYSTLDADDSNHPGISWGCITPLRLAKMFGCQEACTFLESQGGKLYETHDISKELWIDNDAALHDFASTDTTKGCWTCSEYKQILYRNDLVYPEAGPALVLFQGDMFQSLARHVQLARVRCPKTGVLSQLQLR